MKKKILKKGGDGCGWGEEVETILKPKWNRFKKKKKRYIYIQKKKEKKRIQITLFHASKEQNQAN